MSNREQKGFLAAYETYTQRYEDEAISMSDSYPNLNSLYKNLISDDSLNKFATQYADSLTKKVSAAENAIRIVDSVIQNAAVKG